ncbi:potassium channel family protein [Chelativorans salis]|uniref:Potassium channel family protein n=1 Tax=Chelativorans salis TaxID=2978478 RepID=A0ABT2LTV5_9HYPH|nr:potassium channel family protein [Chelativorans sp. EGI FJ00035]MCT7377972.1 potassium channel family protein [Chelativorans sp. EGI FJ00035]
MDDRPATETQSPTGLEALRERLRLLYHGHSSGALRFQYAVMMVDLLIVVFFVASPVLRERPSFLWIDYSIATLLALDITARAMASKDAPRWLRQPTSIVDVFILLTLLFPLWLANLGFLRVLRLWSLSRSGVFWRPLVRRGYAPWREVVQSAVNLITFLFVVTGFIYTFFFRKGSGFTGYIDALYFTVTSMTTTGYGDILLPGPWGKLTAVVIMLAGISLFIRLGQAIFRPQKVRYPCPQCGLQRHDPDAVHCKACGYMLKIPDPDE